MSYRPLVLSPNTPAVIGHVVTTAFEPLLKDVHSMLRLPIRSEHIEGGCNFSILHVLLGVASGVSATLFSTKGRGGKVFQQFLVDFYPWDREPRNEYVLTAERAANVLYEEFRNPFAHVSTLVLDISDPAQRKLKVTPRTSIINRIALAGYDGGLPEFAVEKLESDVRPQWLTATLMRQDGSQSLTVESLYWGLRIAIVRLCSDSTRMKAAAQFFSPILKPSV